MAEGDMITSGKYKDGKDCAIVHLENMKYDKEYSIFIKGVKYKMILSNQDHLWIVPT